MGYPNLAKTSSFMASVVVFLVSLFSAAAPAQAQWHNWPQWQRYGATVNVALSQNGYRTGMQCKDWVRFVIYSASCGSETIPSTKPNMYEWYPDPYVYKIPMPYPPQSWRPGQVVQMKWGHVPHTAIVVVTNENNGMYWLDCNWYNDRTVRYHFVSFADFASRVGQNYSVYEIH